MYSIDLDGNLETFDVSLPPEQEPLGFDESPVQEVEFQDLALEPLIDLQPKVEIEPQPEVEIELQPEVEQDLPPLQVKTLLSDSQTAFSLVYKIKISSLDHKEIQEALMKELLDPQLGLDSKEVKKMIQIGTIKLEGLAPLVAREIVLRLKDVSAQIEWEAYAD